MGRMSVRCQGKSKRRAIDPLTEEVTIPFRVQGGALL